MLMLSSEGRRRDDAGLYTQNGEGRPADAPRLRRSPWPSGPVQGAGTVSEPLVGDLGQLAALLQLGELLVDGVPEVIGSLREREAVLLVGLDRLHDDQVLVRSLGV